MSKFLGIHPRTIYAWREHYAFPVNRLPDGRLVLLYEDFIQWMRTRAEIDQAAGLTRGRPPEYRAAKQRILKKLRESGEMSANVGNKRARALKK